MKEWLKRIAPDQEKLSEHKHLRVFGRLLQDPNLWHLNRRSAAGAFAVGLLAMYGPPVGQMLVAAAIAIVVRVNLPISVALVWISNPITYPPMYYFAYMVGCWILGMPVHTFEMDYWLDWHNWREVLAPISLGCLVCGIACSASGYFAVQVIWRWNLVRQIRLRKARYRAAAASRVNNPSSSRQT